MAIVMSLECFIPSKTCYIYGPLFSFVMHGGSIDMGGSGTSAPSTWNHVCLSAPTIPHSASPSVSMGLRPASGKTFYGLSLRSPAHLLSQGSLLILLGLIGLGASLDLTSYHLLSWDSPSTIPHVLELPKPINVSHTSTLLQL